ncbi:cyclic nucleotide-binding domain-containing protein [Microlunatus sp. GCM10028923]|uniref:cyclic nucleotide-binding domain-containing protein n=1 Tax=Microlunatus sp. GCM10028923 TaxID=3273400 RepID=UPI00361F9917
MLRQGDPGTHVLVLLSGVVKIVRFEADGRVRLLAFRGPGEVVGELAVQDDGSRLADVVAMTTARSRSFRPTSSCASSESSAYLPNSPHPSWRGCANRPRSERANSSGRLR